MPEYCVKHEIKVRLVHELAMNPTSIPISGIGGFTSALGYAIINVQIGGILSYNEEQVALVIEDVSGLGLRVPVILRMPTIYQLCRQMKESKIGSAPDEWQHTLLCYEVAQGIFLHPLSVESDGVEYPTNTGQNPMDLDEQLILTDKVTIPAFASQIVKVRTKKTYMKGHRLNVMIQPSYPEDKAHLPVGLYVQRVYTNLKDGSQNLSTVVWNSTSRPIHLVSGRVVGRVMAANAVPDAVILPELEEKLAKEDGEKPVPLMTEQCQKLLMEVLTNNGSIGKLDGPGWTKQTALKAKHLLLEFHHVFSLKENEMGCTDAAEHVIELLEGEDEPFKERFRRIAPHEVEEVRQHIQMLDGGAIHPSQSPWCNAVVLVRKKDGTLRFCIDFQCLNAKTKKDSHPLPQGPETMESLVGARYFSTMDLKSGFWQIKMSKESRQYMAFTVGSLGIYEFLQMLYGLCNAPAMFQCLMQNCLGELNLQYALIYLDDIIFYSQTPEEHLKHLQAVLDHFAISGLKLKPSKCHFFKESLTYLGHEISAAGMLPGQESIQKIAEMGYLTTMTGIRKFLGMTGYFQRFIKNYARIAEPLSIITGCENTKLKNTLVMLMPEAKEAFNTLKKKCMTVPVLAFTDL